MTVSDLSVSWFRDVSSSAMEEILVLTYSHWWDKADTPYMEYVVYSIAFKYLFFFFSFFFCVSVISKNFKIINKPISRLKILIPFVKIDKLNIL